MKHNTVYALYDNNGEFKGYYLWNEKELAITYAQNNGCKIRVETWDGLFE